jgi:hypothetical protein
MRYIICFKSFASSYLLPKEVVAAIVFGIHSDFTLKFSGNTFEVLLLRALTTSFVFMLTVFGDFIL